MIKQVLSVEQMLSLKRLDIDISSAGMCWCYPTGYKNAKWELEIYEDVINQKRDSAFWEIIPAFTLQDIIELMPRIIDPITDAGTFYLNMYYYDQSWVVDYLNNEGDGSCYATLSDSIIDAAYDMLCWCIENGYIGKEK